MPDFEHSVAVVVGIDAYGGGIPPLSTAVADARAIAAHLEQQHGYDVELRVDAAATRAGLVELFEERLPRRVGADDRLLIYFAGHGVAQDGDDGPEGFLLPQDARTGPEARASLLPMAWLHRVVQALPCRHRLLMLDCCFAGSFRWSGFRSLAPRVPRLYRQRYARFIEDPAAQVLTSAAADQKALDVVDGLTLGSRVVATDGHSPFAAAVLAGLGGAADLPGPDGRPDGVITASELYIYVRDVVERTTEARSTLQTPGLWPLPEHGRGEYLFNVPGRAPQLAEDPRLDEAANPWRGLRAYGAAHAKLFFGRDLEIEALRARLEAGAPLIAVLGASGTGKSSLVLAGLLPRLDGWQLVGPLRPGADPPSALGRIPAGGSARRLVVVDQLEEVFTHACPPEVSAAFFAAVAELAAEVGTQVVVTLRSDFEAQVAGTALGALLREGRFVVPPMGREGLRAVIDGPAELRVLYFEPPDLPDRLVDEVVALPGGLPLLSFTLAEMYRAYIARDGGDRALTAGDYEALGGVTGSLRTRAEALYDAADPMGREAIRRIMLRLITNEGGELTRRRALASELAFTEPETQARVDAVVERFVTGRLLVRDTTEAGEAFVEPAHDALILGWHRIYAWMHEAADRLPVRRAVLRAARAWRAAADAPGLLWSGDPRLPQAEADVEALNRLERSFVLMSARRRRRRRVRLWVVVILVMVVLAGTSVYALLEADRADANAEQATVAALDARARQLEAERQREIADERTLAARNALLISVAHQEKDEDAGRAALVLAELADPNAHLGARRLLLELARRPYFAVAERRGPHDELSPKDDVVAGAFVADGRLVTMTGARVARVWPADGGPPVVIPGRLADRRGGIHIGLISPKGERILTVREARVPTIWRIDAPDAPLRLHHPGGRVQSAAFSPDGRRVALGGIDGVTRIWPVEGGSPLVLPGRTSVARIGFSADGRRLMTRTSDRAVHVWDAATGEKLRSLGERARHAWIGPRGARVLISEGSVAGLWSVADRGSGPLLLRGHAGEIVAAAFSADGARVVTGARSGEARIWNTDGSGRPIQLGEAGAEIHTVAFDAAGTRVMVAGDQLAVWRADGHGPPVVLTATAGRITSATLDGERLLTGTSEGAVTEWTLGGAEPAVERVPHGWDASPRLSPDGGTLAIPGDTVVHVRHRDGSERTLRGHTDLVADIAFGQGGRIATASFDGTARIWPTEGSPVVLDGHGGWAQAVAFSPDGTRLATGDKRGAVRLWPITGGAGVALEGRQGAITALAFSPDGRRLASSSRDGTVEIRALEGSAGGRSLTHEGGVQAVHFSPDGQRLALVPWGDTISVHHLDGSAEPVRLDGHFRADAAAFSPDGRWIATAGRGVPVRVWPAVGEGDPLDLGGDAGWIISGLQFTDGATLKAFVRSDQTIRTWTIDAALLARRFDAKIRRCLPVGFRTEHLNEAEDVARENLGRCRTRKHLAETRGG